MISKGKSLLTVALGLSQGSIFDPALEKGAGWVSPAIRRRGMGPSGSPKRNQERARKTMAQRSRTINRMRKK